jgi:hypothetical protein
MMNDKIVGWNQFIIHHSAFVILLGSVGVPAAHLRGKEGDRVRFPDGPLDRWACMPLGATDPCKVGVVGSTPIRSTWHDGLMVQGEDAALAWRKSEFDSRWVH